MNNEYQYINIREALSRTLRHPMLLDINLESAVLYVLDFIGIFGMPKMYANKLVNLDVEDYRAKLPCDLVSVIQVKDTESHKCLRSITDSFMPSGKKDDELAFKIQGQVLITSFETGNVEVAYKAIPVDDEGYPLLIDNAVFLKCLDAYIKKEAFTVLFDMGRINLAVLQNAQLLYAWLAGLMNSEFTIPSISEMESITRSWNTLLQRVTEFDKGFKTLGDREYIKTH